MQPFLGWVLELEACFAESGFWLRCWYGLDAVARVNCAFAAMRRASRAAARLRRLPVPGRGRSPFIRPGDRVRQCFSKCSSQ